MAFNGTGNDPSSVDQSTLAFTWNFGDGSPSASGGPNVTHSYATPGTYTATLTVCDSNGACASDARDVIVGKRATTLGYLGANTATFATPTTVNASLTDELGQPVSGRSVSIQVGSAAAVSATTDGTGLASASFTPQVGAGTYSVASNFGGDSLYKPSAASGSMTVGTQATTLEYTGSVTGAPNKVITLSAILKNASGTPLAGRVITFQLGAQSATAITDANGIATTTLKLAQKNGTYNLTTAFTPAGADAGKLASSGDVDTFKLQAK